ncbi:MAG TPA: hypothetical protein VJN18_11645 [Polyangiaceae bacterium]|nr:hypothetical protein [Polyangiaceae bacterium]
MARSRPAPAPMRTIEILYFDGCPGWREALERVHEAITQEGLGDVVAVRLLAVQTDEQAIEERFLGSPSVRLDGHDIEPDADERNRFGLQCRVYDRDGRLERAPSTELIRASLVKP